MPYASEQILDYMRQAGIDNPGSIDVQDWVMSQPDPIEAARDLWQTMFRFQVDEHSTVSQVAASCYLAGERDGIALAARTLSIRPEVLLEKIYPDVPDQ